MSINDPYALSELDKMLFDLYVPYLLLYKLSPADNHQRITDSMQRALDKAAEQLPPDRRRAQLRRVEEPTAKVVSRWTVEARRAHF